MIGLRSAMVDTRSRFQPHHLVDGAGRQRLVDAAHERGLIVLLDVVYNHFGSDGNYLHPYAPEFFHPERHTPWGAAIAYDRRPARDFFIDNGLYWLEEYRFDGLRLDAIDQI
jgi:maltooligosyltrehalose trehalohydrolase